VRKILGTASVNDTVSFSSVSGNHIAKLSAIFYFEGLEAGRFSNFIFTSAVLVSD
jgi:hypothetical protein